MDKKKDVNRGFDGNVKNFFKNILSHILLIIYILLINFMIILMIFAFSLMFNINAADLGKIWGKLYYIFILIISYIISLLQLQGEQVVKNDIKFDVKKMVKIYNNIFYFICALLVIIKL